jgi:hypothetical protein
MQAERRTEGGTDTFPLFVQCTNSVNNNNKKNSQMDCNSVSQIQYTGLLILKQL